MDAPLPGIGPWEEILKNPLLWHFRFGGPDMERLVAGRERIYLDRFWNEFSADPKTFSEASREHYAQALRAAGRDARGLRQFAAFDQDAIDNKAFAVEGQADHAGARGRRREVLRPDHGGRHALRRDDVTELVIPSSGHWLMEEQPAATVAGVRAFLDRKN